MNTFLCRTACILSLDLGVQLFRLAPSNRSIIICILLPPFYPKKKGDHDHKTRGSLTWDDVQCPKLQSQLLKISYFNWTNTVLHAELNSINEITTLNTRDTTIPTYMFGIFNGPRQIWGITAYLKKKRSRLLKVCGLPTTVKNKKKAWIKLELHCSYVSGSTITPSPRYDWGMEGTELHCSYANKIKTRKATKLHEKHKNEGRKENLDHNRIMKWFIPGNLCEKGRD